MSNKRYIKANIDEEEIVETPTTETEEVKVEQEYEIILARPDYFIINKNGTNELINKKNNYKKGDMVRL